MPCESLSVAAHRADLLIHEATFAEADRERAAETGHSTAAQAAALALEAEVAVLRDEARAIFPATVLPRDFDSIEIPVPERGRPELLRFHSQVTPA